MIAMSCKDALNLVEAIAAGDVEPDASARGHFESCPRCASALASARRIEAVLSRREAPAAPARFTQVVLGRVRRERWRSEQQLDRVFNIGIAAALMLVVGGAAAMLNLGGVLSGARLAWSAMSVVRGEVVAQAAPTLAAYVGALGLLVSALAMWWWAERRLSL
jgi:hypothetical protein